MAQSKQEIQSLLQQAGSSPRHRFGQNFMIDQNLVRLIADAGELSSNDLVIEVGPGTGTLTDELLSHGGQVVAVEIDRDLAGMLRERFASEPRFELIEGDALDGKHAIHPQLAERIAKAQATGQTVKLVANLPYNIASPLVVELLLAGVTQLAFTVQKEVADRLKSKAGEEAYGPITVMVQMLSDVEVLRTLPPQAFWPQPKIDSALVRLRRADRLQDRARGFGKFVQRLFAARRKTLRRALAMQEIDAGTVLADLGIDDSLRPERLTAPQLHELFLRLGGLSSD
jgi:16S rRNA (adenine1518-N6/adenine1519-N6)-dimethyltransferase